jgi:phage repressor protein C with HTH and peptisase S24 domain
VKPIPEKLYELAKRASQKGTAAALLAYVKNKTGVEIPKSTFSGWLKPKEGVEPRKVNLEYLQAIAKTFDVTVEWILGQPEPQTVLVNGKPVYMVPILNAYAGAGGEGNIISEEIEGYIAFPMKFPKGKNYKAILAFTVSGNSMAPELRHGDEVLVDTEQTEIKEGVYLVDTVGGPMVKFLQRLPSGDKVRLSSSDVSHPPTEVTLGIDYFKVIGKVIGLNRDLRW